MVAAEKAQNPGKGVYRGSFASSSFLSRDAICAADVNISSALSCHQPGGAGSGKSGGSTGPLGSESGVGINLRYSRPRNKRL